ncbi:MAG: peptidylprolyl isomerase [Nitrospirae bacterium]|nr:peptidylprolyl isomerase [Nitrospirota bacterium]
MSVSEGSQVSIEYTLRLDDKTVIDSNVGGAPLTYVHGSHQIIPGLEKSLTGMKVGDKKEVRVKPEDGYGPVDNNALLEVNKEQVPSESIVKGSNLQGRDNNGNIFTARVTEVKDKTVVLDFNHPLAGKTLYFEVKVLNILDVPQP